MWNMSADIYILWLLFILIYSRSQCPIKQQNMTEHEFYIMSLYHRLIIMYFQSNRPTLSAYDGILHIMWRMKLNDSN